MNYIVERKRRAMLLGACALGVFCCPASLLAQGSPMQPVQVAPQVTGAVSGRVVAADTQRPARFADVSLIQVQDTSGTDDRDAHGHRVSGRTDLEGNFTIANVPVGDYYLTATKVGYVSNATSIYERASSNGSDTASLLRSIPQVHVAAGSTSQANLLLERGGVIAGRLLWDDGSPVSGVAVSATSATSNPLSRRGPNPLLDMGFFGGAGSYVQTDDRGLFRLTSLAAGGYVVRATFSAPPPGNGTNVGGFLDGVTRSVAITLYAPGKLRRGDATVITLAPGEERDDVVFTADLHALHSVSGTVSSASNTAVHSGSVRLVDSQDTTLTRYASLNPDGTFVVPYVPAGTYTLSANASSATPQSFVRGGHGNSGTDTSTAVSFQPLQQTLVVTDADITGLSLSMVPATNASAATP